MYKLNKMKTGLLLVLLVFLPAMVLSDGNVFNVQVGNKLFSIEPLQEQPLVVKVSVSGVVGQAETTIETRCWDGIDNDGDDTPMSKGAGIRDVVSKESPNHQQMYSAAEELSKQNPDTSIKIDKENLNFFEQLIETDKVGPLGPCLTIDCWAFYLENGELLILTSEESYSGDVSGRKILPTSNGLKTKEFIDKAIMKRGILDFMSNMENSFSKNAGAKPRSNLFGKGADDGGTFQNVPGTDCTDSDCLGKVGPNGGICCLEDDDCDSGTCGEDNECVSLSELGESCGSYSDCISKLCVNEICTIQNIGESCTFDENCVSGSCGPPDEFNEKVCIGELDSDGDTILDIDDNCPDYSNYNQLDMDGDGAGDACDDSDGDGYWDEEDGCPELFDESDECLDTDNDGYSDDHENSVGSDPNNPESFPEGDEGDSDGDGILDNLEPEDCVVPGVHNQPGVYVYPLSYPTHAGCQKGDLNKNGCINLPDWGMFLSLVTNYFENTDYDGPGDLNGKNGLDLADWGMFLSTVADYFTEC